MPKSHVFLTPGMFGFGRLARFDYFEHVRRALAERLAASGHDAVVEVCEVHPTASIRRRGGTLAALVERRSRGAEHVHLVGHSTGGLDARLVASPTSRLGLPDEPTVLSWLPRLRSVVCLNTPHYGTPLAAFFATVSGQRLLYAVSALTVMALRAGAPPLAMASALLAALRGPALMDLELKVVDRAIDEVVGVLDEASSKSLRAWLRLLRDDQGAIVQLTPEAMDLFAASVEDRPGVRYACVATFAPLNQARDWLVALRSPWTGVSAAIFTALANVTGREDPRYPCRPFLEDVEARLRLALGEAAPEHASDGVVPLRSQVHGEIVWAGRADHLDVVGHYPGMGEHNDWLASGARFNDLRFGQVMDAVAGTILRAC